MNPTKWHIKPSFKYDVLCLLNIMTGDPYYLDFYKEDYDNFSPILTSESNRALGKLKSIVKDKNGIIISAWLALHFSATEDESLDDMLVTLDDLSVMKQVMQDSPYYDNEKWSLFVSVVPYVKTVLLNFKEKNIDVYWENNTAPVVNAKIKEIEQGLGRYSVIDSVEKALGHKLSSDSITVFMLYYNRPHGIKIIGTSFLTNIQWNFNIVIRNAVHEMMHPPYDIKNDKFLKESIDVLREDKFIMYKVMNHNRSFGYNTFEGYVEENCVQSLDQIISEVLGVANDPGKRWKDADDGMHVLAVVLYKLMREDNFYSSGISFRDYFKNIIDKKKLEPGKIEKLYNEFYS